MSPDLRASDTRIHCLRPGMLESSDAFLRRDSMKTEINRAMLQYEVDGPESAPPVLLWNGGNCTLRMWDSVVERIGNKFRLIRFNVRGVGESMPAEISDTQYSVEQYVDDANGLLDHCGVTRCHIWSMAWGTRPALAYCALNPERVISAALYEANTAGPDVKAQRAGMQEALEKQIAAGTPRFEIPDGIREHANPETVSLAMRAGIAYDLTNVAPKLTMPVLIATGDHDPNLPSSRKLVKQAPNAQLVVMENVGHGSVLQRPDLATEIFLDFQASLASA